MVVNSKILGSDLAKMVGIDPDKFKNIPRSFSDHNFVHPYDALSGQSSLSRFRNAIKPVSKGDYKTGEMWEDTFYDITYLYLGKTEEGVDVALNLGGDTGSAGCLEYGVVNSGEGDRIFFDRRIAA